MIIIKASWAKKGSCHRGKEGRTEREKERKTIDVCPETRREQNIEAMEWSPLLLLAYHMAIGMQPSFLRLFCLVHSSIDENENDNDDDENIHDPPSLILSY